MDFLPSQERSLCHGPYGENSLCNDRGEALPRNHPKGPADQMCKNGAFGMIAGERFPAIIPKAPPISCASALSLPTPRSTADWWGLWDDPGEALPRYHRKANFPHRGHRKVIALVMAKSPSQSDFIIKRSDRYARHHCIVKADHPLCL